MQTSVLFIIFNRPETTFRVFEEIRKARPEKLFIAGDGPRKDNKKDIENCKAARKVAEMVDWDCEVKTLFREQNLGCSIAPSSAITWFFENVEQGIILEDDCLPSPDFFFFCEELLNYYRDNTKIMTISGSNFQFGKKHGKVSYYFSKYPQTWGWATWRRAWNKFKIDIPELDEFLKSNKIKKFAPQKKEQDFWIKRFKLVQNEELDAWDYQWVFTNWNNDAISISPNYNLISNIGFGDSATHTFTKSPIANMPLENMNTITHPSSMKISVVADNFIFENIYGSPFPKWHEKTRSFIVSFLPEKVKSVIKNWIN